MPWRADGHHTLTASQLAFRMVIGVTRKEKLVYRHVLVGTDGSPTASRAVQAAAHLAHVHRATLTIVHAFDPRQPTPGMTPAIEAEFPWLRFSGTRAEAVVRAAIEHAQAVAGNGLHVHGRVEPGAPAPVLTAVSEEIRSDAIVVGNADVRRMRLRRSVGHALSRRVGSDVVIVDTVGRSEHGGDHQSVA